MQVRVHEKTKQMHPMNTDSTKILQKPEHKSVFTIRVYREKYKLNAFIFFPNMISIYVYHLKNDRKMLSLRFIIRLVPVLSIL